MNLESPIDTAMEGVIWRSQSQEPAQAYPRLTEDIDADLVVIGGGYCGLATALQASKRGLSVVLLEAGVVGGGASGRNGGFVVPQFPGGITPSLVSTVLGSKKGAALADLVVKGADSVFRSIEEHGIHCNAEQRGWIQPAHSARALERVRAVYEGWKAWGADVRWLDSAEVATLTGAAGYRGGWTNASGGTVNPYALALGLARAATDGGVRIYEKSPVDGYDGGGDGTAALANGRCARGRTVIMAVNGYADGKSPAVQRAAVPVRLFHVATAPLSDRLRASILPTGMCFTDLRKSGGFGRLDAEGRLIAGGAVFALGDSKTHALKHVRERARELFPTMTSEDAKIEAYWEGYCAVTDSYLPQVQILGHGLFAVGGFSTRGVNLAQGIGRVMGDFAAGQTTLDDVPLAVSDRRRDVSYWALKTRVARFMFPFFRLKDRLRLT